MENFGREDIGELIMAFRIRKTNFDGVDIKQFEKEYEANDKLYREHLEKVCENKDSDLWKFFYWDTFHDGYIEKVSFWDTPGDITLRISCPNIKKRNGDSFDYILTPIEFECRFRSVVHFHYEHDKSEELVFEQNGAFEFRYSEIDTLTEIISDKIIKGEDEDGEDDTNFHSIIIEVCGVHNSFYVEMVFNYLNVIPKEPVAFELMLASDEFYVPIYRENEDIDKLPKWITR